MRLKYIEIQGFKSFPDKTRVAFEQGMTAIVGPNGSGKSNISDAVRWVLGEQSTKSLRGDKMEDVIFGGTQLRRPMGFAQVSLCLDNSDRRLPDADDQLIVCRRFYRSGDSEYLLNGATVRLRDVRETFMDTGLGRDGYSIIGQGKISEIVGAKSTERREIFEEASGIAKYRFRKNEASRKLAAAEDNLSRLRDILDELTARLAPLEEQRNQALRFIELSDEKKSLEITLYCDIIERSRDSLRGQGDKIDVAKRDYENIEEQIEQLSEQTEHYHELNRERNVAIERYNEQILETNEAISAAEREIAVRRNDIGHAEGQIAELRSAVLSMSDSGGGFNAEIEAKQFSIDEKNAELTALDEIISKAQSELDSLIENNGISDRLRAEASKNLSALQAKITDLRVDSVSAVSSVELFKERAQTLESQLPEVQTRLAQAKTERAENEEYLSEIKRDSAECDNLIKGYTMKQDSRAAKLSEIAAELEKKQSQISEARNRANVLRDMEHSMEGFTNSVKKVSQASDQRELRGIVGTVASLITVREGCELAVETALGAAAQNIVVADERAAKQAIVFLKENRAGRATFLPLDTIKPSRFDDRVQLSQPGVVGLASELVSCDARFGDVMSSLLGRIIVAEELDSASVLAKKLGYRYRVVTMDGQVINAGGSYTGGFTARSAGIFSRKSEIEKLEAKANEIDNSCASTRAERDKLASERTVLEAQIQAASADLANHAEDRLRVQTRLAQLESEVQSFESSVAAIERELEKLAADRAEKERRTEQNDERLRDLLKEAERLENESGGDGADDFMKCRSELSELLSERRIERAEKQKDIESANYAIEQFEKQLTDAKGRAGEIEKTIASLEKDNHDAEQTIAQKQAEMESLGSAIAKYRADIDAAVSERAGNEREITETQARYAELTRQREEIARETSRLEERKVALQSEYDSANAKLWEEYELTRAEARGLCVEFESITSLRQQVASLRSRIRSLGNVNVGAIEEFKEVHERTEFLGAQVSDVERSRADLLKLIDSLEIEMKTIFTASFNEINTRFRKTFVELFGGGRANLYLSDESDVLESGIEIDVQPSGKVINNLAALSGGEQSLVAIAIYFAILGVNPSPFCILDEIDSALDESNVSRFANYLARVTERTQIIAITHRRGTMEAADVLYGVTMQEEGVSKLLRLDVDEARLVIAN